MRQRLQGFPCLVFAWKLCRYLLARHSDPAPIADQAHGPEQIPLDHEAVEAPDALLRVDPMQHKMEPDRGTFVVHHDPSLLTSLRSPGCEGVHDG
jgi:hypothetical protein